MTTARSLRRGLPRSVESLEGRRLLAAWVIADPAFGDDGLAGFAGQIHGSYVFAAPLAGGKILAVGYQARPDDSLAMVARYNGDGTLDTSFSGDGVATAFVCAHVSDALVQPDGKVVVGGELLNEDMFVARFNADGTPDTAFGTGGMTTIDWTVGNYVRGQLNGLALAPDGKIVLTGSVQSAQNINGDVDRSDVGVARLNANGTFDASFGVDGRGEHSFGGFDVGSRAAVQPDGKIIVAGYHEDDVDENDRGLVIRYLPDGTNDTTFADNGILRLDFHADIHNDQISALALRPDGTMYVGGGFKTSAHGIVQRVTAAGAIDASFGGGTGRFTIFGAYAFKDIAVDSAGRIVVIYDKDDGSGNWAARITPAGAADLSFTRDGTAFIRGDVPRGVNVDAQDRVLIGQDMGLLRLAPRPGVAISTSGKLYVTGGDGNDTITVDVSGGNARVVRNGVTTTYPLTDVTSIDLVGAAGNDTFTIALDVPVAADLGAGADKLTIAATTPVTNDQIRHVINAGDGNDTVEVGAGIPVRLDGEAGNDVLTVHGKIYETLFGSDGDDTINATGPDNAVIFGGKGNDSITTGAGADFVWADDGNDTIITGAGEDNILMGLGSDSVVAGDGDDHVLNQPAHKSDPHYATGDHDYVDLGGGTHDITLIGYRLTIIGGPGIDKITPKAKKSASVDGGGGNDQIYVPDSVATVNGGEGNDFVNLTKGGSVSGDAGDDDLTISGGGVADGGAGNDRIATFVNAPVTVRGGDGRDWITAWGGPASVYGEGGYDTIWGSIFADLISGGGGKDRINGGEGNDRLYGGANYDQIDGSYGRDRMFGGDGDDKLFGLTGNDTLDGGAGYDWLCGGKGNDMIFARDDGEDWIDGGQGDDWADMDEVDRKVSVLLMET